MLTNSTFKAICKLFTLLFLLTLLFSRFAISKGSVVLAQEGTPPPPTEIPPTPTNEVISQIVGGAPADPGEWPWQVVLVNSVESNLWYGMFCGGSLASSEWIVTAAHCVYGKVASQLDVVAGVYDLWNPAPGYQRMDVSQIIIHPSYNPNTNNFDLALLRLSGAVNIGGTGATKTALIPRVLSNVGSLSGVNAWVTGWGTLSSGGGRPDQLYEVTVPIITNTVCNNASHYNGEITSNMLCAGFPTGGKDSCQGDSGGPLVVQIGGQWQLAGAVSWGYGCALPQYPGVYARISNFVNWINSYVPRADAYETDNSSAQAKTIADGSTQSHSVVPANDTDWVQFQLSSPAAVSLETNGSTASDTQMWLYNSGLTELKYDDDGGSGNYSHIDTCNDPSPLLPAGTYYVKIDDFGNNNEIPAYTISFTAGSKCVGVDIGGAQQGIYALSTGESHRASYALDSGPVQVASTDGTLVTAALRDSWFDSSTSTWTSFVQMMGLPKEQLSDTYYFPSYNNVSLSGQLRFGNVDTVGTWVRVVIGGVQRGRYFLDPSEQVRVEYALDSGPVVIESETAGVKIIAALRDAWYDGHRWTSFAQMMGLPKESLSDTYYFPSYNNINLSGQLRFGNVDTTGTWVRVVIGGVERGRYYLDPSEQARVEYALDSGPVVIQSETAGVKIIAALRDAWYDGVSWTSFVQIMGLPKEQLADTYYIPAYNNVSLSGQLRFGNVDTTGTWVRVVIGGVQRGRYFLDPSEQARVEYNLDSGPVVIESETAGVQIIAALRDSWYDGRRWTSYAQLMGLPANLLSNTYYFPSYNNVTVDGQLRFGIP